MRPKQMAVLTLIESHDGSVDAIITSHPDKNELETLLKHLVELVQAFQKGEQTRDETPEVKP